MIQRVDRRPRRGMTLIELVIGVVITGAMASIGAATFGNMIDHRRVILDSTQETERAAALRSMVRTWIESGSIDQPVQGVQLSRNRGGSIVTTRIRTNTRMGRTQREAAETGVTSAVATGDELRFTTNALADVASLNVSVRLFVDNDSSTPEEGLTIEFQRSRLSPLERRMVDSTITGMTVEYLNAATLRWVPDMEASTIPRAAVRVWFSLGESREPQPLLQLPLFFALPNAADAIDDLLEEGDVEVEVVPPSSPANGSPL